MQRTASASLTHKHLFYFSHDNFHEKKIIINDVLENILKEESVGEWKIVNQKIDD